MILVFDGGKFLILFVLEEAGTETESPVIRAYGLVCATRGTKLGSRWEEEQLRLKNIYARILPPLVRQN